MQSHFAGPPQPQPPPQGQQDPSLISQIAGQMLQNQQAQNMQTQFAGPPPQQYQVGQDQQDPSLISQIAGQMLQNQQTQNMQTQFAGPPGQQYQVLQDQQDPSFITQMLQNQQMIQNQQAQNMQALFGLPQQQPAVIGQTPTALDVLNLGEDNGARGFGGESMFAPGVTDGTPMSLQALQVQYALQAQGREHAINLTDDTTYTVTSGG